MALRAVWMVFLGWLSCVPAQATSLSDLAVWPVPLGAHIDFLVDDSGELSIEQLRSPEIAARFASVDTAVINRGFVDHVHWYRLDFAVAPDDLGHDWYTEISYPLLDEVKLYLVAPDSSVSGQISGDQVAKSRRALATRDIAFPLRFQQPGNHQLFWRVDTESSQTLPIRILDANAFARWSARSNLWLGLYYGFILIAIVFSGLVASMLRNAVVLQYGLFVLLAGAILPLSLNGYGYLYFWGQWPWLTNAITPMSMGLALIFAIRLTRATLSTADNDRFADRVLRFEQWLCAALVVVSLIGPYALAIRFGSALGALMAISVIATSLRALRHHRNTAILFMFAWGGYLLSVLVKVLTVFGGLPTNVLTDHAMQLGIGMLIIVLALALGERMNAERKERAEAKLQYLKEANERRQAEEAGKMRTAFLAKMSHELRTPMNAVIGFSELGMRRGNADKRVHFLAQINAAATGLLHLINEILDFSKIDAQELRLERRPMSLERLLTKLDAMFQLRADEKDIGFVIERDADVPDWLVTDPLRLEQVLTNLISNAMKFTEHGGVEVFVSKVRGSDGAGLRVRVRDTGIGISSADQDKLFQAFQQADDSITRRYGGTGLGLVICKQLIELMGGRIGVDSEPGQGSEFWFEIPLLAIDPPVDDKQSLERPADGMELPALSELPAVAKLAGRKILLAEDNVLNQQLAAQIMEGLCVDLTIVENGRLAVEQVRQQDFDVVLMDIFMPEMDGYTAAREIRRQRDKNSLPIVAMTASVSESDRQSCFEAGMNDFVPKPVRTEELVSSLLRQCGLDAGASPALPAPHQPQTRAERGEIFAVAAGLEMCQNDAGLFARLLEDFLNRYAGAADSVADLLADQDHDAAHRVAHTVKGLSATLGLESLREVAEALEQSLRAGTPDDALVQAFAQQIDCGVDAVRAYLQHKHVSYEPPVVH